VTRVLQDKNQISDAGAAGLGEGLKVNSSLQGLALVRLFDYCLFFVGAIRGEGGERVSIVVAFSMLWL
jgi:hypothetical protein